jgi:hypothetical protein
MLTCFKSSYLFNKIINDYCRNSTNESIKTITDKYNLERNKPKIKNPFIDEDNDKSKVGVFSILGFLTISTIVFFLYKRLK